MGVGTHEWIYPRRCGAARRSSPAILACAASRRVNFRALLPLPAPLSWPAPLPGVYTWLYVAAVILAQIQFFHQQKEALMTTTRRDFLGGAVTAGVAATADLAQADVHDHQDVPSDIALRVKSLESLLVEKKLVDRSALDAL